jgi:hypothetical protein
MNGGLLSEQPFLVKWADERYLIKWLLHLGIFLPLILAIYSLISFCLIRPQLSGGFDFKQTIYFFGSAIFPFALIVCWRTLAWSRLLRSYSRDTTGSHSLVTVFTRELSRREAKPFLFRNRFVFPALCTCVSPFVAGWCLAQDDNTALFLCAVVLVCLWIFNLFVKAWVFSVVCGFLIFGSIITSLVSEGRNNYSSGTSPLTVVLFGFLLALVMGVAEAWRITTSVRENKRWIPVVTGSWTREQLNDVYMAGTNIATVILPPVFFLTYLHPSTTGTYFAGILLFSIIQIFAWFVLKTRLSSRIWSIFGIIAGLFPPVLVALATSSKFAWTVPCPFPEGIGYGELLAVWTIVGGAFGTLAKRASHFLVRNKGIFAYLNLAPCIALTGIISATLLISLSTAYAVVYSRSPDAPVIPRLGLLIDIYTIGTGAALVINFSGGLWLWICHQNDPPNTQSPDKGPTHNENARHH